MAHFSLPDHLLFVLNREVERHYVAATTGLGGEPGTDHHLRKQALSLPLAFLSELQAGLVLLLGSSCQTLVAHIPWGTRHNFSDSFCLLEATEAEAITRKLRDQLIYKSSLRELRCISLCT
jgi:hypothetical protein